MKKLFTSVALGILFAITQGAIADEQSEEYTAEERIAEYDRSVAENQVDRDKQGSTPYREEPAPDKCYGDCDGVEVKALGGS